MFVYFSKAELGLQGMPVLYLSQSGLEELHILSELVPYGNNNSTENNYHLFTTGSRFLPSG